MKRVTLEYGSEITISDAAFEQIAAIVKANRVCGSAFYALACVLSSAKPRQNASLALYPLVQRLTRIGL
jgi:hypothetical protein